MEASSRHIERNAYAFFNRMVYAAIEDYEKAAGKDGFSHYMYQSYSNLIADKDKKMESLKGRFTFGATGRKLLVVLMDNLSEECKSIEFDKNSMEADVPRLAEDSDAELLNFMIKFGAVTTFGSRLEEESDSKALFSSYLAGKDVVRALEVQRGIVAAILINFLKKLAFCVASIVSFGNKKITENSILSIFSMFGMSTSLLDDLETAVAVENIAPITAKNHGSNNRETVEKLHGDEEDGNHKGEENGGAGTGSDSEEEEEEVLVDTLDMVENI